MFKYFYRLGFVLPLILIVSCTNTKQHIGTLEDTNYVYMDCEITNEYGSIDCGRVPISIDKDINSKFLPNCSVSIKKIDNKDKVCLENNIQRPVDAYILGNLKIYGISIDQNEQEGLKLIDYAIGKQYPEAVYWLAQQNQNSGGDLRETLALLKQAVDLGNPLAIHWLGVWYLKGIGVEKNLDKSLNLLNKSKKYIPASYSAIALIDFEKGDIEGFINKNNIAAEKGFLFALVDLSALYLGELDGLGGYRDLNKVNDISNELIDNNIAVGYMIKAKMLQEQAGENRNPQICDLYKKSYDEGYLDSGLSLGSEYLSGKNCSEDYSQALNVFSNLVDNGNSQTKRIAASNIAFMYLNGLGVEQNKNKAQEYYKYAAELGFQPAEEMLNKIK